MTEKGADLELARLHVTTLMKMTQIKVRRKLKLVLKNAVNWLPTSTLVRLNSGMASVKEYSKFPIIRRIDVFLKPKIPDF